MGKRDLIPTYLLENKVNPENKQYIDEYFEALKKQNISESTIRVYLMSYDRIFKYKGNWNINFKDYSKDIYETFSLELLDNGISQDRIDTFTVALNKMSDYFKDTYPDTFDRNFLKNLERYNDKSGKNILSRALKPKELYLVKQYLKTKNRETLEYMFNVFFYTDIQKSEFNIYNPLNANFEKRCYEFENIIKPFVPEFEESLMKVKGKKIRFPMLTDYLPHIADYLIEKGEYEIGKTFTFEDIKKTRARYFIKCPVCKTPIENIAENWIITQYENSEYKQLACKKCKGVNFNE